MPETIVPIREKVLVRHIPLYESKTEGGLYLPECMTEDFKVLHEGGAVFAKNDRKYLRGVVVAVGDGRLLINRDSTEARIVPLQVAPGDLVLIGAYGGVDVTPEDDPESPRLLLMSEDEIMAVVGREVPNEA